MSIQQVTQIIQFILAPVVLLTSCAILINGVQTRYSEINSRLRALASERLTLLRVPGGPLSAPAPTSALPTEREAPSSDPLPRDPFVVERLVEIDIQTPLLLRRHEIERNALFALYLANITLLISMFIIALSALRRSAALATLALTFFLAAAAAVLFGVILVALEVHHSHDAVRYEVYRVLDLGA